MVSTDRIRNGVSRYIDSELMPKMTGWRKWVFGAGATIYLAKLDEIIAMLNEKPELAVLGLADASGVDIDRIYALIRPVATTCPAVIENAVLGRITLTERDVDLIYNCITQY